MRSKNHPPKATFESAWTLIQENAKFLQESTKSMQEDTKALKEGTKAMQEDTKAMRESNRIANERMDTFCRSMDESIKAMQQELGGIGKSNGAVAESYFVNSFTNSMQFAGQEYDSMDHHCRRSSKRLNLKGEYDLVLYNCISVVIIEVKYNARQKDVEKLLKKAPVFKQLYPQYANFDLYLGLAAFHFEEHTESGAVENGIAIIKQIGDNMVIYDAHLKVF
ncbi:MAG: hypothetical protein FWD09_08805 [Lentimicrobiaceae bacterium]|nr:hypothetical protein [Lentimicrobiaceae bacterium]